MCVCVCCVYMCECACVCTCMHEVHAHVQGWPVKVERRMVGGSHIWFPRLNFVLVSKYSLHAERRNSANILDGVNCELM